MKLFSDASGMLITPPAIRGAAQLLAWVLTVRLIALWLHELAHAVVALALGYECAELDLRSPSVSLRLKGVPSQKHDVIIRHAGWVASVLMALGLLALTWDSPLDAEDGSLLAVLATVGGVLSNLLISDPASTNLPGCC